MKTMCLSIVFCSMLLLYGCTGCSRELSDFGASNFGSDFIVVQYRFDGVPFACWSLHDAGIVNESGSDGIYWKDTKTGHMVHISGWYNRVQVTNGDYKAAGLLLGVDASLCGNGKYPRTAE